MSRPVGPHPEDLRRGADQRIEATLRALGIEPDGVDRLPVDESPALPDAPGYHRVRRGVTIRTPPAGVDVFAVTTNLWRQGLCQISEDQTPQGRLLIGHDPAGYEMTLTSGDRISLVVASPPLPRKNDHSLVIGIVVGTVLGPAASCMSFIAALSGAIQDGTNRDGVLLAWAWVPVLLVLGGALLIPPSTRRFGTGLMIGTAAAGIITSGFCTALMTGA
ncbi:hypothetical protein [Actinoplanes philippinensis]|uniref:hypothetical protein n=1 Tax=Actinoplanes philippinensis TaxID=35752 RepID=UPI000B83DA14|nr:hypothetical protein [Actinoplanes philippinensis]